MKKNSLSHKDRIGVFVGLFVLAVIVGMLPTDQIHICNGSGILYIVLIIAWSTSVQSRIMHKGIRRLLIFAGVQMGLLFLSRCVRYSLMPEEVRLLEWCWYFYYLFFISKGEIRTLDLTGMSRALSPTELPCHICFLYSIVLAQLLRALLSLFNLLFALLTGATLPYLFFIFNCLS